MSEIKARDLTFESIQEEIAAMLDVPDEDLTDDQKDAMEEYLEELGKLERDKVDGFAQFIKLQGKFAEAAKEESQRLGSKARIAEARIGYLKQKYLTILQSNGLKKIEGHVYTLSTRGTITVSVTGKTEDIPEFYLRRKVEVVPDKKVIKEALQSGLEIPGCSLATSYSLQIR